MKTEQDSFCLKKSYISYIKKFINPDLSEIGNTGKYLTMFSSFASHRLILLKIKSDDVTVF